MFPKENMVKTSFTLDPEIYERFKKIAKAKNSDASKEIRIFMEEYLRKNAQLLMELNIKESQKRGKKKK